MRIKRPFTLYKRTTKDGLSVWHASWYDAGGQRRRASTGETSKARAEKVAIELSRSYRGAVPTLDAFANGFFGWDGSWCRRQIAKGRGCSPSWAASRQAMLVNHVLPRFGKLHLDQLTRPMVEGWLIDLPLSNQTRNHIAYAFKTILAEAEAQNLVERNPLYRLEPLGKKARRRDAFTLEELRRLFPTDRGQLLAIWRTPKYAALYLTLATTGIQREKRGRFAGGTCFPKGGSSSNRP